MKKSVLWCIAICAAAVFCMAAAVLAVMYFRDIYSYARDKTSRLVSVKDKALSRFLSKSKHTDGDDE